MVIKNAMKRLVLTGVSVVLLVALLLGVVMVFRPSDEGVYRDAERVELSVAIAPYQDMAMLVNVEPLGLEEKYDMDLDIKTVAWEDLLPSVASAQGSVDVSFAGLIEFVNTERNINRNTDDPLVFIFPTHVFFGNSFVSFDREVPTVSKDDLSDKDKLRQFLTKYTFAAEPNSLRELTLFSLARAADVPFGDVDIVHIGLDDALLAALNGDVDIAGAGLTQRNEALEQGGRVVLASDDIGLVDVGGFVVKKSTLETKRPEIEKLIQMWLESVDYVYADIDNNAEYSLRYLNDHAATGYTIESYKQALSQEYIPRTYREVKENILEQGASYDFTRIYQGLVDYLVTNDFLNEPPQNIEPISLTR